MKTVHKYTAIKTNRTKDRKKFCNISQLFFNTTVEEKNQYIANKCVFFVCYLIFCTTLYFLAYKKRLHP